MNTQNNKEEQDAQNLKKGVKQAETARRESYATALTMIAQRHTMQVRERERLARKYGEQSEQVAGMDRKLAGSARVGQATQNQQARAQNPMTSVTKGQWKLTGRVTDTKGTPLSGYTVSLFGKNGWERQLGHTCTNSQGYYTLEVTDAELVKKYDGQALMPTVTDKNQKILHQEKQSLTLKPDHSEVRLIVIDSAQCAAPGGAYPGAGEVPPGGDVVEQEGGVVWGLVRDGQGRPMPDLKVQAVATRDKTNHNLGKGVVTDDTGKYVIDYTPKDLGLHSFEECIVISIHVFNANGKRIAQTKAEEFQSYASRIDVSIKSGK